MAAFSHYIKNVAYFLVFSTFVGIISPSKKYKNYINLIMGLVMIFIVIEPAASLFSKKPETGAVMNSVIRAMSSGQSVNKTDLNKYEDAQDQIIKKAYDTQIRKQLEPLAEQEGFELAGLDVRTDGDLSNIMYIGLTVKKTGSQPSPKPFIRVEPVNINVSAGRSQENAAENENAESVEVESLKKVVSDFYNLSPGNIHIKVIK